MATMTRRSPKRFPTAGTKRRIRAIPHQYSCGGYWLAEWIDPEKAPEVWYGGQPVKNEGQCWMLLSGRMEVLSRYQAGRVVEHCEERGEIVDFAFTDALPEGSRIQF